MVTDAEWFSTRDDGYSRKELTSPTHGLPREQFKVTLDGLGIGTHDADDCVLSRALSLSVGAPVLVEDRDVYIQYEPGTFLQASISASDRRRMLNWKEGDEHIDIAFGPPLHPPHEPGEPGTP